MSQSHSYKQVGANEDCPCGSGKKHIDCCLDSNNRWVRDEKGIAVRLQSFKGAPPAADEEKMEEIPLLRLDVSEGRLTYQMSNRISRLSSFSPEALKLAISLVEIEKTRAVLECFGKFLERTDQGETDEEADTDHLEDGSYVILMVGVDEKTRRPVGVGGRRVSHLMSESALMTLIGALEEVKTDLSLCLTVNCLMNGMLGAVDYASD